MALKLKNKANSVLAASITSTATTIALQAGDGTKFPSLGADDWFPLTLVNASGGYEIVKVTARTNDVLTVVRAQEGSSGTAFAAGDRVGLRLTVAAIATFIQASDALLASNNLSDLGNKGDARTSLGLGTAAVKDVGFFATAAQGTKADSAVQPGALGTAAAKDIGFFATAAQGAKADSAAQPGAVGSAAYKNVGVAAGEVPMMDTGGKYPAADGSQITNLPLTEVVHIYNGGTIPVGGKAALWQNQAVVADGANFPHASTYLHFINYDNTTALAGAPALTKVPISYGTWKNVSGGALGGTVSGVYVNYGEYERVA